MGALLRFALTVFLRANAAHEVGVRAVRYGRAGIMLAVAAVFVVLALTVLSGVGWLALSRRMEPEYAGLIVAGVLLSIAGIIALLSKHLAEAPAQSKTPDPFETVMKSLPNVVSALRPYLSELVTAAILAGLMAGKSRKRDKSEG